MKLKDECLFIVPRCLEVCNSRGIQFVAKICHKCSHPGAQVTRQNLKEFASPARDKNRSCIRGLKHTELKIYDVDETMTFYEQTKLLSGLFSVMLLAAEQTQASRPNVV